MIPVYRNVDSPNGDFGLVKQEGDERFAVLTVEEYAALREAEARANTAKVAAELMRAERDALRALLKEATRHLRNHLVTARWCAEFEDTGATRTNIEREVAEAEAVLPRIDDALGEG